LNARKAIKRILQRQDFVLSEAGTVKEAMARLGQQPDWILLDLMLPDGCGSEILQKVNRDQLRSQICVITGCAAATVDRVRGMGAKHVMMKPLNVEQLLSLLCQGRD